MSEVGLIGPVKTEWASPVIFAPNREGTLRLCGDYRKLSSLTVKDFHLLPRKHQRNDSVHDAHVFPPLSANSGYFQTDVDNVDQE